MSDDRGFISLDPAQATRPKETREAFTFNNFVAHLTSSGRRVTSAAFGPNPPDFLCLIDAQHSQVEVAFADARMPEVADNHRARVAACLVSVATTSEAWDRGVLYDDPYVTWRNDLEFEIAKRVTAKCDPEYLSGFVSAAPTYIVIDSSPFPFSSYADADDLVERVRTRVTVPAVLAGVYISLAVTPQFDRRHYRLDAGTR